MEDANLLQRLREQDLVAFAQLVRQFQLPLKRFVRTLIGAQHAEDVVQEAWLAAWRGLPGFEGRAGLKTWLFTIARNEAIKVLRKNGSQPRANPADAGEADSSEQWLEQQFDAEGSWLVHPKLWDMDTPEALLQADSLKDCIEHIVAGLVPDQRSVLRLREIEQMDLEDIARLMELSPGNIRVLLHRARLQLLRKLGTYHETGEY